MEYLKKDRLLVYSIFGGFYSEVESISVSTRLSNDQFNLISGGILE